MSGNSTPIRQVLTFIELLSAVLAVQFDPTSYSVTEGDQASLTAVLSFAASRDVTVDVSTVDGSATGKYCLEVPQDGKTFLCFCFFNLSRSLLIVLLSTYSFWRLLRFHCDDDHFPCWADQRHDSRRHHRG